MLYLISCFVIVFISSFIGGYRIPENISGEKYLLRFIIPLLCICIILGCRFGWATDYMHYQMTYHFDDDDYYEPIFQGINSVLHIIKAPFPVAFFIYALICYGASLVLFKQFNKVAYLVFPCFVCLYFYDTSNLVRFSVAMAFVMLAINPIVKNAPNKYSFILFSICSVLTHTGSLVVIVLLVFVKYCKTLENIRISIPLFFISCLLSADLFIKPLYQMIDALSSYSYILGDLGVVRYLENDSIKENHFGEVRFETFFNRGKAVYVYILQIIYMFAVIYCGYILKNRIINASYNYIYRLSVLACLLYIPFYGIELIMRVNSFLLSLSSVVIAYSIYYLPKIKTAKFQIGVIFMCISFIYCHVFHLLKTIQTNFKIDFIWNIL